MATSSQITFLLGLNAQTPGLLGPGVDPSIIPPMRASDLIERGKERIAAQPMTGKRPGSREDILIRVLRANNGNVAAALREVRPVLEHAHRDWQTTGRTCAWLGSNNVGGSRQVIPKMGNVSIDQSQWGRMRRDLTRLRYQAMNGQDEKAPEERIPTPPPPPTPPKPDTLREKFGEFRRTVERLRPWIEEREFDKLTSMRVLQDALKILGTNPDYPIAALLDSMTADWPDDSRRQAGIEKFDFMSYGDAPEGVHRASMAVVACVKANVPVLSYGDAGTGKSHGAELAANILELPFYEVNLAGSMPSAVKGRDRLKDFVVSDFTKAYKFGGVCNLDEMDAAPPIVLTAINNAIARDVFFNDAMDERIPRHPKFRVTGTANTLGNGADKDYTSRSKLDKATKDRFRMGRIRVGLDTRLENHILESMLQKFEG